MPLRTYSVRKETCKDALFQVFAFQRRKKQVKTLSRREENFKDLFIRRDTFKDIREEMIPFSIRKDAFMLTYHNQTRL